MPSITSLSGAQTISDKAAQIFAGLQSKFKRRNAIYCKEIVVSGHKCSETTLLEPTKCSYCNQIIVGFFAQQCKFCKLMSHKECLKSIQTPCVEQGSSKTSRSLQRLHQFEIKDYKSFTFCDHCGQLLWGLTKQGYECRGCRKNVHSDCKPLVSQHVCPSASQATGYYEHQSKLSIKDFEIVRLLGWGTFSKVFLARLRHDDTSNEEFAIKVIKKTDSIISSNPACIFTEWKALEFGRQYRFIAEGHCCFQSRDRLFFVMEYVKGRDLDYHIRKSRKFTEERAKFYAAEIVLALMYLHRQRIIHRDIKLENIILDMSGHCKLLDFGMSKELSSVDQKTKTLCGTPEYMSPEILNEQDYGYSTDWWSLGVLIYMMLVGDSPFADNEDYELTKENILNRDLDIRRLGLSDHARIIIEDFLTKDPQNRLGSRLLGDFEDEIKRHPFFLFKTSDGHEIFQWEEIEAMSVQPPYKPTASDLGPDDDEDYYTLGGQSGHVSLTPISSKELANVPQKDFENFSYYSSSFQDFGSTID